MTEETVTISKKEYLSLLESDRWLEALEKTGYINWSGCDDAYDMYKALGGDNYEVPVG